MQQVGTYHKRKVVGWPYPTSTLACLLLTDVQTSCELLRIVPNIAPDHLLGFHQFVEFFLLMLSSLFSSATQTSHFHYVVVEDFQLLPLYLLQSNDYAVFCIQHFVCRYFCSSCLQQFLHLVSETGNMMLLKLYRNAALGQEFDLHMK